MELDAAHYRSCIESERGGPNRAGDDVREAWTANKGPGRTQEMARLLT
jgi:hypothetical protein